MIKRLIYLVPGFFGFTRLGAINYFNGVGIPEDVLDRIFEPFFTTRDEEDGTGLGLSIVWQIVEEHGGKIEAQSQEGVGTVFSVFLPAVMEEKVRPSFV